jgi:uncharacterized RDD family membrane protein YckC/sulfur transfer complex TusBCD TusB component (DsrH family)
VGFAIALAYFGICNSRITGGQTLGKQWLGVRVIDAGGQALSLPRSLLRYTVLGAPFFFNGLPIDPQRVTSSALGYLLVFIVFGGGLAIVYLYLFNRRTRQSLHDLAVGSYVVRAEPDTQMPLPIMWRGHLVAVALLAVTTLGSPVIANRLWQSETFADLLPIHRILSVQPHVMTVQVMRGWVSAQGKESHYLKSQLRLDAPMIDDDAMAKGVAQQMAKIDSNLATEDSILVDLNYGYDMVIASGWRMHRYSFKPDELQ